jgi:pyridoxal biosynthesis lyase PdxS
MCSYTYRLQSSQLPESLTIGALALQGAFEAHAKALTALGVIATTHFNDPKIVAEAGESITGTMKGLAAAAIQEKQLMQTRGW